MNLLHGRNNIHCNERETVEISFRQQYNAEDQKVNQNGSYSIVRSQLLLLAIPQSSLIVINSVLTLICFILLIVSFANTN